MKHKREKRDTSERIYIYVDSFKIIILRTFRYAHVEFLVKQAI